MKTFTKEELITELRNIVARGWIKNPRQGNQGSAGNTLEDLLGIEENNLPLPDASEWELKTHRANSTSLLTLFHIEPSPRAVKFVTQMLLPNYGWPHETAGGNRPPNEKSFRITINCLSADDRGFMVKIDRINKKILISFDRAKVSEKHQAWLAEVARKTGLGELNPQPYWGFDDLAHVAGTKLLNCFFVQADVKKEDSVEYFRYNKILMLRKFNFSGFLGQLEAGNIFIDFDAITGHNHGTKFRVKENCVPMLYESVTTI